MLKSSLKSYHVHRERAISTDGYVSPTPYLADHRWRCHVNDGVVSLPLSPVETQLCDLLKSFASTVGTTPRLAGGFVRDKLIGKETHDIDVTLDTMTGAHFVDLFSDWLKTKDVTCSSVGVISRNPEQSKHLETATARILGLDIDFCNLRSERYAEGSRIPTVEMGTLQQDADRRDFCCNALFYNVATGLMEDLTGRGLHDCTCGIIRTPLDPIITFLDDPLRILRAIRFASRYRYHLDKSIIEAAKDQAVHAGVDHKVSRERVGIELRNMMTFGCAQQASRLLLATELYPAVFRSKTALPNEWFERGIRAIQCLQGVLETPDVFTQFARGLFPREPKKVKQSSILGWADVVEVCSRDLNCRNGEQLLRTMNFATLLHDLADLQIPGTNGKPQGVVFELIRDELKLSSREAQTVEKTLKAVGMWKSFMDGKFLPPLPDVPAGPLKETMTTLAECPRVQLGSIVRETGELWLASLIVLAALLSFELTDPEPFDLRCVTLSEREAAEGAVYSGPHPDLELIMVPETAIPPPSSTMQSVLSLKERVIELGLQRPTTCFKPLLNGKELMERFPKLRGPQLGAVMEAIVLHQIETNTDKAGVIDFNLPVMLIESKSVHKHVTATAEHEDSSGFIPIDKLQSLGINVADINKLKSAGLCTVLSVVQSTRKELCNVKGLSEAKVEKITDAASKLEVTNCFLTGTEVLEKRKSILRITSGCEALDSLLAGGFESACITELFGENRCGKTQVCHTLCVTAQLPLEMNGGNGKVCFIDTEGTFRPEKITKIAERFGLPGDAVLDNILYARAFTHEHMLQLILVAAAKMVEEHFSLLVIDSIMALFRVDFTGRGELADRQQQLGKMLSRIMKVAEQFNIAVVYTNHVMADPGNVMAFGPTSKPIGGHVMGHASTVRLSLKKGKGEQRICKVFDAPNLPESEAIFVLSEGGVTDVQS